MRIPSSTYRLQITSDFDLDRAAELVPYLRDLGVGWVYLSPVLQAEEGSTHGYDVTDPTTVDRSRGGREGLERLARAAHAAGLGVLIDIVPNHQGVATPAQNPWWRDLLQHGEASRYAEAFDVDWRFGNGRIRIPVLGDEHAPKAPGGRVEGLAVEGDELVYFEHRFPLAPGSLERARGDAGGAEPDASAVHDLQHYELVSWRAADAELNYRRFFAVNTLAGVRVEVPWVYDETHREIASWFTDGLADGLRVDHPDGLRDPAGYLERLAETTGGAYVLVEKILEPGESLPRDWATAGTTGYDALAEIDRVLTDPEGRDALWQIDTELRGGETARFKVMTHETKRMIADTILRSEVLRLDRELRAAEGVEFGEEAATADALAEILACFPVYRSYLPDGRRALDDACWAAERFRPDLAPVIGRVRDVLADPAQPVARRFQQTSGMVMAKGVEDTAFYRYTRLTSLCEVGGDPSIFSLGVDEFHDAQAERLAHWPATMTTLTTHDTKRGEDTRARITALAEVPELFGDALEKLVELFPTPAPHVASLVWQAIIGAWPASRERLHAYVEKAIREGGEVTRWTAPDRDHEAAYHALVDAAFDHPVAASLVANLDEAIREAGWVNGLSAKLVQLMMPGVPDVYQGSELWERSLVDPDNRRPVDYEPRRAALDAVRRGVRPPVDITGAAKLLVTHEALRVRRDHPDWLQHYEPLHAKGATADHALAFARGGAVVVATRLPLRLAEEGGWLDTTLEVPLARPGVRLRDAISGEPVEVDETGAVPLARLLERYPVALIVEEPLHRHPALQPEDRRKS